MLELLSVEIKFFLIIKSRNCRMWYIGGSCKENINIKVNIISEAPPQLPHLASRHWCDIFLCEGYIDKYLYKLRGKKVDVKFQSQLKSKSAKQKLELILYENFKILYNNIFVNIRFQLFCHIRERRASKMWKRQGGIKIVIFL